MNRTNEVCLMVSDGNINYSVLVSDESVAADLTKAVGKRASVISRAEFDVARAPAYDRAATGSGKAAAKSKTATK